MRRVLLDTNIYGEMAIDRSGEKLRNKIIGDRKFVFYGLDIIRKELRDTSKTKKFENRNLRVILLSLYDQITKEHTLQMNPEVMELAENFYRAYREFGGLKSKPEINRDFLIVSCATLHGLDIVVSDDEKTMLTENAVKAYKLIADVKKKRLPNLTLYDQFRRWFV